MNNTFEKVRSVLVEALNVEEVEVTPKSSLYGDLGAESIDMMDITFRLEKEFGVKIEVNQLFPTGIFRGDNGYVSDGMVTEKGLKKLRETVPHASWTEFAKDPKTSKIPHAFTVESLVNFVESRTRR